MDRKLGSGIMVALLLVSVINLAVKSARMLCIRVLEVKAVLKIE